MGKIWDFVKILKIEPYMFMLMFSFMLKLYVSGQLIQDKVCMLDLKQPMSLCINVTASNEKRYAGLKDLILKKSNVYSLYANIIATVPGVFYTFFVGSWSDRFVSARKLMLLIGAIGVGLDTIVLILHIVFFEWATPFLLLAYVPSSIIGGFFTAFTAIYSYASKETPPEMRSIRFAVLELCLFLSNPVATILPSIILPTEPWIIKDRIRNYMAVYIINFGVSVCAFLWVFFVINEVEEKEDKQPIVASDKVREEATLESIVQNRHKSWLTPFKSLFDTTNIKTMFKVCLRKREADGRFILWLIITAHCLCFFAYMGSCCILYPFTEKVFFWSFQQYSVFSTVTSVAGVLATMIAITLFVRGLKFHDLTIGIIGSLSIFMNMAGRGSFLSPTGFYVSYYVGILAAVCPIACRAYLSKLVGPNEGGSVFAVLSCIESIVPLSSSLFFTKVFNATIDTMPGLVYQVTGALMVIPVSIFLYVDICRLRQEERLKVEYKWATN